MRQAAELLEEFLVLFDVKVYSDPKVDSPIALGNLTIFYEPLVSGTLGPGCVSLRRFGRISKFLFVKVISHPEVDSACMCDEYMDVECPAGCDFFRGFGGRRLLVVECSLAVHN